MSKYRVTLLCEVPNNVTYDDFMKWLIYEIDQDGEIEDNNPLLDICKRDIVKDAWVQDVHSFEKVE